MALELDDNGDFNPAAYTTIREYAETYQFTEDAVRQWIHRRKIKAVGQYPDRTKIYLHADISAAEHATRYQAKPRRNPILAADQRRHRAQAA